MTDVGNHVGAAFVLGFALGAAPGPVQLLLLTETAKRGLRGGLRVMAGANTALAAVMLMLALGLSSLTLGDTALRVLFLVGGGFVTYLAVLEIGALRRERTVGPDVASGSAPSPRVGPVLRGVLAVAVSPGVWVFAATTAAAVIAGAMNAGGRPEAVLAALAIGLGVSLSDLTFTTLGSAGHRLIGDRGLWWVRLVLACLLAAIGLGLLWQGRLVGGS